MTKTTDPTAPTVAAGEDASEFKGMPEIKVPRSIALAAERAATKEEGLTATQKVADQQAAEIVGGEDSLAEASNKAGEKADTSKADAKPEAKTAAPKAEAKK